MTTLPVPDHPPPGASGDPGPADLARLVESCRGWPGTDGLTVQAVRAAHSARPATDDPRVSGPAPAEPGADPRRE